VIGFLQLQEGRGLKLLESEIKKAKEIFDKLKK